VKPTTYARLSRGLIALAAAAALFAAVEATASGGADLRFEPAPVHRLDDASLQRGARTFVNYCLNCHSAKYMRYNRLQDIGLTEEQIRDNLILGDAKIGDTMSIAMRPVDAKGWFGAPPPDLSVESRVRGKDWLYNYLIGFYRDEASATGWNNLVFPNVGMPHVLWSLSGTSKLASTEYENHEAALAAAIGTKGLALVEPLLGGKYVVRGGKVSVLEGSWPTSRFVVLEFPTAEQARAWWDSDLYRPAKALRHQTATTKMILVEVV